MTRRIVLALEKKAAVAQLFTFDALIDTRSPAEYREDHIPGAMNCPVLSDEEWARVGTLYKQVSPFEARKLGAALVSRNIAGHLETLFRDKPRDWRPLVYCWRGGQRSGAMTHVLREVGWDAHRLEGGYKAYRRRVAADLAVWPEGLRWRVICGPTGSGKSRLLEALARAGAQTLDLEGLAAHRGSVLGALPDAPQPSQKAFETRLWDALRRIDAEKPVFVEAESKKIGAVRLPEALAAAMRQGACVRLEANLATRIALLKDEYRHFLENLDALGDRLDCLRRFHGAAVIAEWKDLAQRGAWDELVAELLIRHYDPAYLRSTVSHYPRLAGAPVLALEAPGANAFDPLARRLLEVD